MAATDSGVSCALLLDIIRSLGDEFEYYSTHKSAKINNQLSLQIVFFDGEEAFVEWTGTDSIYGSRALAKKWKESDKDFQNNPETAESRKRNGIENIELFILLDLIGAKDPIPQFRSYSEITKPAFMQFSALEAQLVKEKLYDVSNIPQSRLSNPYIVPQPLLRPYGVSDDHVPFEKQNVPIVHFIPYGFPKVWHSAGDDLSAVDYVQVHNWSVLLRSWVAEYFNFI